MKEQLKALLETCDPSGEIFNPETINEICGLFESKLNEKVLHEKEILIEQHQKEIDKIDIEHTNKFRQIMEKVDEDSTQKVLLILDKKNKEKELALEQFDAVCTDKLKLVIEKLNAKSQITINEKINYINTDHAKKLLAVKKHYETVYENKLVEKIGAFLDTFVEEYMPEKEVIDTIKLEKYENMFNVMKKQFLLSENFVDENVQKTLAEKDSQLSNKDKQINELLSEKVKLNTKLKKIEAETLLDTKTLDMLPKEKNYIKKFFESSSVEEIRKSFNEAVMAFRKSEEKTRQTLVEGKKGQSEIKLPKNDQPILNENTSIPKYDENSQYIKMIEKLNKSKSN